MEKVSGGCLCGKVRFSVPATPLAQVLCHCTDCQTVSGSAFCTAYITPYTTLEVLQGEVLQGQPGRFTVKSDAGRDNTRCFCRDCGSRLWAVLESGVASVNGMALDDRTHFKPTANHRLGTAPSWCQINAALPEIPA